MNKLTRSIFNFVEEAFNALDEKMILSEMISDAKAKYGNIYPTSSQDKFELTFDEAMPDIIQFWFNTEDDSTHLEFYEV